MDRGPCLPAWHASPLHDNCSFLYQVVFWDHSCLEPGTTSVPFYLSESQPGLSCFVARITSDPKGRLPFWTTTHSVVDNNSLMLPIVLRLVNLPIHLRLPTGGVTYIPPRLTHL